jgi:hypothetical protein
MFQLGKQIVRRLSDSGKDEAFQSGAQSRNLTASDVGAFSENSQNCSPTSSRQPGDITTAEGVAQANERPLSDRDFLGVLRI